MARHKNKVQDTQAILNDLIEARKASREVKHELLEHNNLIKLHADYAESDTTETPGVNGKSEASEPLPVPPEVRDSAETPSHAASSLQAGDLSLLPLKAMQAFITPWIKMQMQVALMMFNGWPSYPAATPGNA